MTLETNDELLLTMLFFGFLLLRGSLDSLPLTTLSAGLLCPNTGAGGCSLSPAPAGGNKESALLSQPLCFSWWLSPLLDDPEAALFGRSERICLCCDECFGAIIARESFVPADGSGIAIARGLGLTGGASEGCGGGVASRSSSRRMYVPIIVAVNRSAFSQGATVVYLRPR